MRRAKTDAGPAGDTSSYVKNESVRRLADKGIVSQRKSAMGELQVNSRSVDGASSQQRAGQTGDTPKTESLKKLQQRSLVSRASQPAGPIMKRAATEPSAQPQPYEKHESIRDLQRKNLVSQSSLRQPQAPLTKAIGRVGMPGDHRRQGHASEMGSQRSPRPGRKLSTHVEDTGVEEREQTVENTARVPEQVQTAHGSEPGPSGTPASRSIFDVSATEQNRRLIDAESGTAANARASWLATLERSFGVCGAGCWKMCTFTISGVKGRPPRQQVSQ